MKTVVLIRHAKSSWKGLDQTDFERPLNKRGQRDAPVMGARLLKRRRVTPDLIVSSPAQRAVETAMAIAEATRYKKDILWNQDLYLADVPTLLAAIWQVPNDVDLLYLVAHNPGLTDLSEHLSGEGFANVPTCGTVEVEFDVESWSEVAHGRGRLLEFDYPKREA